jgi:hypothetical protein
MRVYKIRPHAHVQEIEGHTEQRIEGTHTCNSHTQEQNRTPITRTQ